MLFFQDTPPQAAPPSWLLALLYQTFITLIINLPLLALAFYALRLAIKQGVAAGVEAARRVEHQAHISGFGAIDEERPNAPRTVAARMIERERVQTG